MAEEDNEENEAPFPQANDFGKILKIIKIEKESLLQDNEYLEILLNVSKRQVNYYLAACSFLGITNNSREFSNYGLELRNKGYDQLISYISSKIISIPVFGDVFFSRFFYDKELSNDDIAELLTIEYKIQNYSVAKRRASTVNNWINWIYEQKAILI